LLIIIIDTNNNTWSTCTNGLGK